MKCRTVTDDDLASKQLNLVRSRVIYSVRKTIDYHVKQYNVRGWIIESNMLR